MLKSRWAPVAEDEAPKPTTTEAKAAPAQQETATPAQAAPAPPAIDMSYDTAYSNPSIDPFAQTAGTDDLFFDDDITPISQPVVEQNNTLGAEAPEFVPAAEEVAPPSAPQAHLAPKAPREPRNAERGGRGRGRGRGEGRGRGRGGRGRGGPVGDIRLEEQAAKDAEAAKDAPAPTPAPAPAPEATANPTENNEPPSDAPTGPSTPSTASVRGDRTLTGGSKRTRLTEAELSAKVASMRSKNEALAKAHARAEADATAFKVRETQLAAQEAERKKLAAEKQKAERKDRQQMMGERERNRQRKLNAQGGREWDLEKEDGFDGTGEERRRGAARGAYGGVSAPRGAPEGPREFFDEGGDSSSYRGRGGRRGGRGGRGGGGGGGRGDFHEARPHHHDAARGGKQTAQRPPTTADFPELPSSKPTESADTAPKIQEFKIKGKGENKSEDIRKSDPELKKELEPAKPAESVEPKASEGKTDEAAPERPAMKKVESFGLKPMEKGQSWADDE